MKNLTEQEEALYKQIVATENMKLMFDWARSIGRLEILKERLEELNNQ